MSNSIDKSCSIIPGGAIQFLDFDLPSIKGRRLQKSYIEYLRAGKDVDEGRGLRQVYEGEAGVLLDCETDEEPMLGENDTHHLFNIERVLEPYLGQWIPIPFFRIAGAILGGEKRFLGGPTDWARAKVTRTADNSQALRLTIAFDTVVEEGDQYDMRAYGALTPEDISGSEFALAHKLIDLGGYLGLHWVREWIKSLDDDYFKIKLDKKNIDENPHQLEYIARYLGFLEWLDGLNIIPTVKVINPDRSEPIDVDLVLDIGNARSIGMLIEKPAGEGLNLTNGSTLELRDLSDPEIRKYTGTFSSNICFARADFGDHYGFSRGSARIRPAFTWPSVVRVGPEAARTGKYSRRQQGQTSISSPKRYLWDLKERVSGEGWRYSPLPYDPHAEEIPVNSGEFVSFINNLGMPIAPTARNMLSSAIRAQVMNDNFPVTEPKFCRSSMMMFLLSELISHALVQINSPENRSKRGNSEIPRRLSRLIITVPPAMSVSERKLMNFWIRSAIDVLWEAMGWKIYANARNDYRRAPVVKMNLDEASSTQVVFIYNEIALKFSGDSNTYFRQYGRPRDEVDGKPSIKIASIDVGGGTTDMVITTYANKSHDVASVLEPHQAFRESLHVAGDDILQVLIEKHILPWFNEKLQSLGGRGDFLGEFNDNRINITRRQRVLRAQFTQNILYPVAINLIKSLKSDQSEIYEDRKIIVELQDVLSSFKAEPEFGQLFKTDASLVCDLLQHEVMEFSYSQVGISIRAVLADYLTDLCEVVHKADCDFLLLSGWPSCLPILQSLIFQRLPLPASRIIPMSEYKIEKWFPFSDAQGRITDPKTTGVVGALLAAISEGNVFNFHFRENKQQPASTIRYIGPMSNNKQIRNVNLFFDGVDATLLSEDVVETEIKFSAPLYIGYRQFSAERWKTTPFYLLRFANNDAAIRASGLGLPYTIRLSYTRERLDDVDEGFEAEGILKIEEVVSSNGQNVSRMDFVLQLKSLWESEGHWLDTGVFNV